MFRTYGYEGTRVDDIVERAGISHGAFYLYFRNKEDLLHRMAVECAEGLRGLTTQLETMPRPVDPDDLESWVSRFVAAYHDDGPVIRAWLDNREAGPLMQALANDALGPLARALGAIVDPVTVAAVGEDLTGLGMLALLERLSSYFANADRDIVTTTAARLLYGATAEAAPG